MFGNTKFGFVGIGQMGQAILKGMISSGEVDVKNFYVTDVDTKRLNQAAMEYGVTPVVNDSNNSGAVDLAQKVDVLLLAVSPQIASSLLNSIAPAVSPDTLIVSIMGGISLDFMENILQQSPVIRVMPNTPLMVRKGVSGIAVGKRVDDRLQKVGFDMFDLLGATYALPENLIDPFTGVCGCSPAFAYMFIDALAMGGVERGLPADLAIRMAAQTIAGAAEMILQTGKHPGELIANVCTPAGSTIAGVHVLEDRALRGTVMTALCEACDRMISVGKDA